MEILLFILSFFNAAYTFYTHATYNQQLAGIKNDSNNKRHITFRRYWGVANVNSNYPCPLPESAWDMGDSNRYYVYILKYA